METIQDFCNWIGSQKRAAVALDVSEATISRLVSGEYRVPVELAEKIEQVSHGLFRKERVVWPSGLPTQQGEAA